MHQGAGIVVPVPGASYRPSCLPRCSSGPRPHLGQPQIIANPAVVAAAYPVFDLGLSIPDHGQTVNRSRGARRGRPYTYAQTSNSTSLKNSIEFAAALSTEKTSHTGRYSIAKPALASTYVRHEPRESGYSDEVITAEMGARGDVGLVSARACWPALRIEATLAIGSNWARSGRPSGTTGMGNTPDMSTTSPDADVLQQEGATGSTRTTGLPQMRYLSRSPRLDAPIGSRRSRRINVSTTLPTRFRSWPVARDPCDGH